MAGKAPVVSAKEAKKEPYPYVSVARNGVVIELDEKDREYLETPFDYSDSTRPYVKARYQSKDGWGSMEGFCPRKKIPKGIEILPSPTEGKTGLTELERELEIARTVGATIVENGIGGYRITFPELSEKGDG